MAGFVFAILNAAFSSAKDILSKNCLREFDEYISGWSLRFFAFLVLCPLLLFIEIPPLGSSFWQALFLGALLNVAATILFMKALKKSEISRVIPLISLEPAFLLITAPLVLGEYPNIYGLVGVLLMIVGTYSLNVRKECDSLLDPFRTLAKHKGSRIMIAVTIIWGVTTLIDKVGILNSSPVFWAIAFNGMLTLLLTPVMLLKSGKKIRAIPKNIRKLLPLGGVNALSQVCQVIAFSMTQVSYVAAVKRTGSLLTVCYGGMGLKEKHFKRRLFATVLMLAGALLIILFS
ncbi:MAG: EamA family transporter [Candidatus Aenigmarchaeota archaeon]|nr:EamA family transporter [Candidatus Aenigmarchaeota archaeon]